MSDEHIKEDGLVEQLINSVHARPCLWNMQCSDWKDRQLKENSWTSIGKELGRTAADCKTKWGKLRDMYVYAKERKKMKKRKSGDAGGEPPLPKWQYFKIMQFIDSFVSERSFADSWPKTEGSTSKRDIDDDEDAASEMEDYQSQASESPAPTSDFGSDVSETVGVSRGKKRRKRASGSYEQLEQRVDLLLREKEDEFDHFGKSTAAKLRRLPSYVSAVAQIEINKLLLGMEFKDQRESQRQESTPSSVPTSRLDKLNSALNSDWMEHEDFRIPH